MRKSLVSEANDIYIGNDAQGFGAKFLGIEIVMDVAPHELIDAATSFTVTRLLPWVAPNPEPKMRAEIR